MIAYMLGKNLYINITNRCTNRCSFCIRDHANSLGYDLWLDKEPTVEEIIAAVEAVKVPYEELVFCGYGEPMLRLPEMMAAAKRLKKANPQQRIRINTNGQADLIWKRPVAPELAGWVDAISISLNAGSAPAYQEISRPAYGEKAYEAVLAFAAACVKFIPEVTLSVVDTISEAEIARCAAIAKDVGARFRVRHYDG